MYTLKSHVEERVPSWEECKNSNCQNGRLLCWTSHGGQINPHAVIPHSHGDCPDCNGDCGTWHDAVILKSGDDKAGVYVYRLKHKPITLMEEVTKSSFLVRRWGVCGECGGKATVCEDIPHDEPCPYCHKDADGKPTGAEPDTAGEWEVE